jgi:hypothetical protein
MKGAGCVARLFACGVAWIYQALPVALGRGPVDGQVTRPLRLSAKAKMTNPMGTVTNGIQ